MEICIRLMDDNSILRLPFGRRYVYEENSTGKRYCMTGISVEDSGENPVLTGASESGDPVSMPLDLIAAGFSIYELIYPQYQLFGKTVSSTSEAFHLPQRTISA